MKIEGFPMKKFTVLFMVIVMTASLFVLPVSAETKSADEPLLISQLNPTAESGAADDEGTVRFYHFNYSKGGINYIKRDGFYYACTRQALSDDGGYYLSKREFLTKGEDLWKINLLKIAEEYKYEVVLVSASDPVLCSDKYLYLTVDLHNIGSFEGTESDNIRFMIMKVDTATGEYELFDVPGIEFFPQLVKTYKGKLYFNNEGIGLFRMDENGKIEETGLIVYHTSFSQPNSKSRYIYSHVGMDEARLYLRVHSLKTNDRVREIKAVRGYYATDSRLYYGKISDSRFKVYSANLSGSKPKVIFSLKIKSGKDYELSKVTSKYIYYKRYPENYPASAPICYRYSRAAKKIKTLSYADYSRLASDFRYGYVG